MIKVGQIRKFKNYNKEYEIYAVVYVDKNYANVVFNDGMVFSWHLSEINYKGSEVIAEYPTWQEAVNSPEFNGEK